jgi:hypothetical protein
MGNYSILGTLKPAKGAKDYTEVVLENCRRCRQVPMIGVHLVTTNRDKNGKESKSKKTVVMHLVADQATCEMVRKASIATAPTA